MRKTLAALALAMAAVAGGATGASAAAAPAAAPAAATPAGWHTEHSGTTSTLYDVGCLGSSRCFAVGDGGTLLATTNGGRTWHHETSPVKAPLYAVACVRPASCYVIARPETVLVTHDAGAHWSAHTLPLHISELSLPGCVIGDGSTPQGEVPCRLGLLDIACSSPSVCNVVATAPGGYDTAPVSRGAQPGSSIWLTRNGGATWTRQSIPSSVGCDGDCGSQRYGYPLEWISCAPSTPCWAGGNQLISSHEGFASAMLVTPAPGGSWRLQPGCPSSGPCSEPVTDVGSCPTSSRCYAVNNTNPFGYGSSVGIYTETGRLGPSVTVPANTVIYDIACPASRTCYTAGKGGTILRTTNGTRFTAVKTPARENLNGITCVTTSPCYAVGAAGTIEAMGEG